MKTFIAIFNDCSQRLSECLTSVSKLQSTTVLVVDPTCDTGVKEVCSQQGAEYFCQEDISIAAAYNYALDHCSGDVINFSLSSSKVVTRGTVNLESILGDNNLLGCDTTGWNHTNDLERAINYKHCSHADGVADFREDFVAVNPTLQSYFVKTSIAKQFRFDEDLLDSCLHKYLLQVLEACPVAAVTTRLQYEYHVLLENTPQNFEGAKSEGWYAPALEQFIIPVAKELSTKYGSVPQYLQSYLLYLVHAKYNCNYMDNDKGVLSREQAFQFDNLVKEFLVYVDDAVLFQVNPANYDINNALKVHFHAGKYEKLGISVPQTTVKSVGELGECITSPSFTLTSSGITDMGEVVIDNVSNQKTVVKVLDKIGNKVEIDIEFFYFLLKNTSYNYFLALSDKAQTEFEKLELVETEAYSFNKYFGITIDRRKTYHVSVPLKKLSGKKIYFAIEVGGQVCKSKLSFPKAYSRLRKASVSYVMLSPKSCLFYADNCIVHGSVNPVNRLLKELRVFKTYLRSTAWEKKDLHEILAIRLLYWLTYPVLSKKKIWLTFDKLYKAGDNGEYMFQYCRKHAKEVDIYYIVDKDAPDYKRLRAQHGKHVLKRDSTKVRLLSLFAETILATHASVPSYLGYTNKSFALVKDLFKGVIVCIQHGLTIQKIAQYQNRIYDDTRLYTLASPYEKQNVLKPIYDFQESALKLTGLARYDGLKSNDKKQILITPTWRRNLVNISVANVKKTHNDSFKNSEYFKVYNSLINDKELIDCAKKTGYSITYLLHPAMSSQAEDFDKNDFVTLLKATGDMSYEKILTESSLMVTDYSGVQFDFAYQRKPLVYYHPDSLPPHYDEGGLIYETMGFGPICKNHKEIVTTLCEYMQNGCTMTEEYVKRADDFFQYDDFNNCQRIYEEVTKFMNDKHNF